MTSKMSVMPPRPEGLDELYKELVSEISDLVCHPVFTGVTYGHPQFIPASMKEKYDNEIYPRYQVVQEKITLIREIAKIEGRRRAEKKRA